MTTKITWITQSGFIFEHHGQRLVVDPYISNAVEERLHWIRLKKPPIPINKLHPDTIFCSHNHIDHLDPISIPLIADYYPSCHFIGPSSVTNDFHRMGIDPKKITTLKVGSKIENNKFHLTATHAYHSDPHSVGLIIEISQKKIYFSGDTLYHPKLVKNILKYSNGDIDFVLICINGKMNNMNTDEAINVVKELQPQAAAPMHYGLFAENTVAPEQFLYKCQKMGIKSFLFGEGIPRFF